MHVVIVRTNASRLQKPGHWTEQEFKARYFRPALRQAMIFLEALAGQSISPHVPMVDQLTIEVKLHPAVPHNELRRTWDSLFCELNNIVDVIPEEESSEAGDTPKRWRPDAS